MKVKRASTNVCLLTLFILCQQAMASDDQAEQPSLELLEFLGSAEQVDGEWLDPLHMVELETSDLDGKQQEERKHE